MMHLEMKILPNAQCNAMPMMVVTNGSRCDLLRSCCHAQPYCGLSKYDSFMDSQKRSKGWWMSKGSLRIPRLAGVRISHRNSLKFQFQGDASCVAGSFPYVSGSESCTPCRKVSVLGNPRGKFGKRSQPRTKRSWSMVYAKGETGEIREKESENRGSDVQKTTSTKRGLEDGSSLGSGAISEQGSSSLSKQLYGEVLGNDISNSEFQKIQDLKFSGDMWEGDSGPQVLDLQRMLYWSGYLPRRTELTAYFGLETKRALQQFQIAHGVPGTGAWGSSSRQALWKLFSEDSSSFCKGVSSACSDLQQPVSSFMDGVTAGGTDMGIRVSELLSNMGAQSQEFMSTMSTAPYWRHLPTNVPRNAAVFGLLVGTLVALFSLGYSIVGFFHEHQHGQPVRRRVLRAHWRDDLRGTTSLKSKRHLDMFPGLDLPLVGEEDFEYRLRSKSRPSAGRTDRLILYEGQVLVGDESPSPALPFMNGPASRRGSGKFVSQASYRMKASLITGQDLSDQTSEKTTSNGSIPGHIDSKLSRAERNSKLGGKGWQDKDEENFKDRVEELRKAVHATEKNRQEAMRALAEERQRSLELQVKISRQKETAAALEEEVRVLKESHDLLLTSLRKKYSSSVAARAAAALLYQNWDASYEEGSPQTLSF